MHAIQSRPFFRHPLFWSLLIGFSLIAGFFSYYYFSYAVPLVNLTISMNATQAREKAALLAKKYNFGPETFRSAAYFNTDSDTQNYIELERGGSQAWKSFIKGTDYYPYIWIVRHFKEGETNEVYFKFTPDGRPYGFIETIAESASGAALTTDEARTLAEQFLIDEWNTDIGTYWLKDSRKEIRASGRVDHTLIYEKKLENLGDAHYLLTVVVTGNKITTIDHSIDIPESFTRSFKNIRSFNDTMYYFASVIVYLLYLIVGGLAAILFLLKKNWLLPKQALYAGVGLAFLQFLAALNQFPFAWFSYDTALSTQIFLLQNLLSMLISFIAWSVIYTTTFIAAEGLTRRAFGSHVQLWSAWKLHAASSTPMLGKTVFSYCIVALDMAFIVLFYAVGTRFFGWWMPSAALTNPNILGTYIPAFGALSQALAAGSWEESLFRAIPLATCALIGRKIGYPKTVLAIGLILQPLIFGAAHANYPALPFYVRIVELFIPFFGFGLIYVFFGLIPVIISHAVFDATLMSLPIFASDAPGAMIQRILVILGCSIPLLIVLYSRFKTGRWLPLSQAFYNGAWQPVTTAFPLEETIETSIRGASLPLSVTKIISFILVGFISAGIWFYGTSFESKLPSLTLTKANAIGLAKEKLNQEQAQWQVLPSIYAPGDDTDATSQHTYIWQTFGKLAYKDFIGNYLASPAWLIRFARFSGDLEQRAEEYKFLVTDQGVIRSKHILPQKAAGAKLDEKAARSLALTSIEKMWQLNDKSGQSLHEVSAQSEAFPNRTDWHFTFAQPEVLSEYRAPKDLARLGVSIAGDEITDQARHVHVPEEWLRAQKMRKALTDCIATIRWLAWFLIVLLAALLITTLWQRKQLTIRNMLLFGSFYFLISSLALVLNYPQTLASFSTAEPLFLSAVSYFLLEFAKAAFESCIMAMFAGIILTIRVSNALSRSQLLIAGICAGLFWTACLVIIHVWVYPSTPWFSNLTGASATIPWVVYLWKYVVHYLKQTFFALILAYFASFSRTSAVIALILAIAYFTPYDNATTVSQWMVALGIIALALCILYIFCIRAQPKMIPLLMAVTYILNLIREASAHSFPGAFTAQMLTIVSILAIALFLSEIPKANIHEKEKKY